MKISACLITKDEEKNIEQCLKSIEGIVDEIIIVDTGSNDNTVNVAKRYSNKIFHYVWEDDFSKARNFAIEKANGDYILFLDADDYLALDALRKLSNKISQSSSDVISFN